MDPVRAQKIAESRLKANVTFQGEPIFIESVNLKTANIHSLKDPGHRQLVLLKDLVEH